MKTDVCRSIMDDGWSLLDALYLRCLVVAVVVIIVILIVVVGGAGC